MKFKDEVKRHKFVEKIIQFQSEIGEEYLSDTYTRELLIEDYSMKELEEVMHELEIAAEKQNDDYQKDYIRHGRAE